MSIAPDLQSWTLSNQAADLMEALGVSLAEVYRVLSQPQEQRAGIVPGQRELRGYGLLVTVFRQEIRFVALDGANSLTWEQCALERALSDQGDVLGADSLLAQDAARLITQDPLPRRLPKPRPVRTGPALVTTHVLDRVHPNLRASITRLVAGDFSRLLIHSPTKVTILPEP